MILKSVFFAHTINKHSRLPRAEAVKKGLTALAFHKLLSQFGAALFGLFLPIFLFEFFGYRSWMVFLYGALYYLLAVLALPLGAKLMTRIGLKKSMIIGVFLYVGFFASLLLKDVWSIPAVAVSSLLFFAAWHAIYWVPFHTAFAENAPRGKIGEAVGLISAARSLVQIVVPLVSGWIILTFGYSALITIATLFILLSALPIFFIHVEEEKFEFGYWQTFRILFSKKERILLVSYAAEGAENSVGFLVWPIFLFLLFNGKYLEVGAVATAVMAVGVVLDLFLSRLIDQKNPQKIFRFGARLTSLGWLMRMFVSTAGQVFFVGAYHGLACILMNTPFEAIMYTRAADAGHYVDEYTVLREIALGIGRVVTLVLLIGLVPFVGFPAAFLVAALATIVFSIAVRPPSKKQVETIGLE